MFQDVGFQRQRIYVFVLLLFCSVVFTEVTCLSCLQSPCILPSLSLPLSPVSLNQDIACPFLFIAASLPPVCFPLFLFALAFLFPLGILLPPSCCVILITLNQKKPCVRLQLDSNIFLVWRFANICLISCNSQQGNKQGHATGRSVSRMTTQGYGRVKERWNSHPCKRRKWNSKVPTAWFQQTSLLDYSRTAGISVCLALNGCNILSWQPESHPPTLLSCIPVIPRLRL